MLHKSYKFHSQNMLNNLLYYRGSRHKQFNKFLLSKNYHLDRTNIDLSWFINMLNTIRKSEHKVLLLNLKCSLHDKWYMFCHGLYSLLFLRILHKPFWLNCNFYLGHIRYMWCCLKYSLYNQQGYSSCNKLQW